jgi:universal stress protein E
MSAMEHIAVAVREDLRDGGALDRGIDLARRTGARLSAFVFTWNGDLEQHPMGRPQVSDEAIAEHVRQCRDWLKARVEPLRAEGIRTGFEVIWGRPVEREIVKAMLSLEPDLLVKDAESGPRRGWSPIDWHLLRTCPVPLMLVQEHPAPAISRVLAAIDPMHAWGKPESLDREILEAARRIAAAYDVELHVANAMEPIPALIEQHLGGGDSDLLEKARAEYEASHRQALGKALDGFGIPSETVHVRSGGPAMVIAEIADEVGADLVVLGTINRRGLGRAVIGSTAEMLLDRMETDVLAIKPSGFVSDMERLKDE